MSLPSKTEKAAKETTVTPAPTAAVAPVVQDTRSYFVMMLLAVFLMPSGLARAYRGEQAGWIRFWVFAGANVLMLVPLLNIVAFLAMLVLGVWGLIDLFLVRKLTTDAAGKPLASTPTDNKWAKGFFIYAIVSIGLVAAIVVIVFAFFGAILMHCASSPTSCQSTNMPQYLDNSDRHTMPYQLNNSESF